MNTNLKQFSIIQANVQSLLEKKDELIEILKSTPHLAMLLSETWTIEEQTRKYNIVGYNKIIKSRSDGYGGVAIYLNNSLAYKILDLGYSWNFEVVGIHIEAINLVLVSLYVNPSINIREFKESMKNLLNQINSFDRIIIGGDLNAHHRAWGCAGNKRKGEALYDLINVSNFTILNDGSMTHIPRDLNKQPSAIDITICSSNMIPKVTWQVQNNSLGKCAHLIIKIDVNIEVQIKALEKKVMCKNKIFKEIQNIKGSSFCDLEDLQEDLKKIVQKHTRYVKFTPKNWWTEELSSLYQLKKVALLNYNRVSNSINLIELNKIEAKFVQQKKFAKKNNVLTLINKISPQSTSAEAWKLINNVRGSKKTANSPSLIDRNLQSAEQFMQNNYVNSPQIIMNQNHNYVDGYQILDMIVWRRILKKKAKKSAPGDDKISYNMLLNLNDEAATKTITELNKIYNKCQIPSSLKTIKTIAVPKPGRNPNLIESYRPIALQQTMLKTLNIAVHNEMDLHINKANLIPSHSFGFRKNCSTITCLGFVTNTIMNLKRQNKKIGAIFFDLSNAFNDVNIEILIDTLKSMRFPVNIINWIHECLINRPTILVTNNNTITFNVSNGLPQGDVNAPTLFNLYTSTFHEINSLQDTCMAQFADDFIGIVSGLTVNEVEIKLQVLCDHFVNIADRLKLKVNTQKTKYMMFNNSNKHLNITMSNQPIIKVNSYKYLGVILDRNLNFGSHIRNLKNKVDERINMLKVINGTRHGSHPQTMLTVYKALVTNLISYGSAIYGNTSKTYNQMLEVAQRKSLRIATGCTKTTPINSLAAIAATEPLSINRVYSTKKEIAKYIVNKSIVAEQLRSTPKPRDWEVDKKITFMQMIYWKNENDFAKLATLKESPHHNPTVHISDRLLDISLKKKTSSKQELKQAALETIDLYTGFTKIYTDASKLDDGNCGIGIYDSDSKRKISSKLSNNVNIMSAELTAIQIACSYINHYHYKKTVILTDSLASCKYLKKHLTSEQYNEITHQICFNNDNTSEVWIQWIPSHVGLQGNEIADALANEAHDQNQTVSNKILLEDGVVQFKNQKYADFDHWYQITSIEKGHKYYEYQNKITTKPWFYNLKINGPNLRTMNRLLCGHDYSGYWLGVMKIKDSSLCDVCAVDNTASHIILECTKFLVIRTKYKFDRFNTLRSLIGQRSLETLNSIIKFLHEIDIII